jgi:hypothetical protein
MRLAVVVVVAHKLVAATERLAVRLGLNNDRRL